MEHAGRRVDPWIFFDDGPTINLTLGVLEADALQVIRCAVAAAQAEDQSAAVLHAFALCLFEDIQAYIEAINNKRLRVAIMLARPIFEGSINAMRVAVGDEEASRRAVAHWEQKAFRDLDRKSEIGACSLSFRSSALGNIDVPDSTIDAVNEFSRKNGKEIMEWGNEDLINRIDLVMRQLDTRASFHIHMAFSGIYRHSSDVLHGTFAGAMHALGWRYLKEGKGSVGLKNRTESIAIVSMSVAQIVSVCVEVLASRLGMPELAARSSESLNDFLVTGLAVLENRAEMWPKAPSPSH